MGAEPVLSCGEALRRVDQAARGVRLERECVDVRAAHGRILARDEVSRLDAPPFDKSAMDGYAVMAGDVREAYLLLETVPAGAVPTHPLREGYVSKVMTGAPVPEGTGQVVRVEDVDASDGLIRLRRRETATHVMNRGEDLRVGEVVLRAGARLSSVEVAALLGCGLTQVEVWRRPRVAILSTGDELVTRPDALAAGKIVNTNGPMLALLAAEHGLELVLERGVADRPADTEDAIRAALAVADVVVLSGGVSVGDFDFVGPALASSGLRVLFTRLLLQPGRAATFAVGEDKLAFGLPGNPVAVFLMFHLLVMGAVAAMTKAAPPWRLLCLPLAKAYVRKQAERLQYVPCRVDAQGSLETVPFHGSAHLLAMTRTDGFLVVPVGVSGFGAGERVDFMALEKR